jgi:hypothetical protein
VIVRCAVVKREVELQGLLKKNLIFIAPISFCALMVLDWTGVTDGGFPSTWRLALVQIGANVVWTVFLTFISYFSMRYIYRRSLSADKESDVAKGRGPERNREQ